MLLSAQQGRHIDRHAGSAMLSTYVQLNTDLFLLRFIYADDLIILIVGRGVVTALNPVRAEQVRRPERKQQKTKNRH